MYLKYIQIRNFRNHQVSKFSFEKGSNTVIGENDSGKSNAMMALRILLDSSYYYGIKQLKESDFSNSLNEWRGEWIIISAMFDEISIEDKTNEVCAELIPTNEDETFLRSYIRCGNYDYGVVTLYIRPIKKVRQQLATAEGEDFERIREGITLADYEFFYTSRSQADFLNDNVYKSIVGDFNKRICVNPDDDNSNILGTKIDILDVWQYVSLEYIDALRDVSNEMRKNRNPLRRIFDMIKGTLLNDSKNEIVNKIRELNHTISSLPEIEDIGSKLNVKLDEMVGLLYSPEVSIASNLREDIDSLAKYLTLAPSEQSEIELLGLGHLNILYIAMKMVEFEYYRNHEILNIMIVEEPEAHIHTHIQKTLFENFQISEEYTQIIMTTHSTHISEVADIRKVNVLKAEGKKAIVMNPACGLDLFGENKLQLKDLALSSCLERYLDAKRSVLLFSKGVILVEGDGEEILIPAMVKRAFGVSLDELGIGLINVGSVSFEYIASIFHEERIQRKCAIITDYDAMVKDARKCKEDAAKRGVSRKLKLDKLFGDNEWVEAFYAPHTFEVDFANEASNCSYITKIIDQHYVDKNTKDGHIENVLGDDEAKRYDSVLTIAKSIGKGWYATLLAADIETDIVIPQYIIEAIAYASQEILSPKIVRKMVTYARKEMQSKNEVKQYHMSEETVSLVKQFMEMYPENMVTRLLNAREKYDV